MESLGKPGTQRLIIEKTILRQTITELAATVQLREFQRDYQVLPTQNEILDHIHCHHGGRSQQAAEHFAANGFTNVHNVVGGIQAWSEEIDKSVPQY